MQKSDQINELAKALLSAQAEFQPIAKDSQNPHFKNTYASLGTIIDQTRPILAKNGLVIIQTHKQPTEGGEALLVTTLLHTSGQYIESSLALMLPKQDMQGLGSATSYGRRYSLLAILNLAAEDDDGHKASETKPTQIQMKVQSGQTSQHQVAFNNPPFTKGYPSEPQLKRLYAIRKSNHCNDAIFNDYMRNRYGFTDPSLIPTKSDYESICKAIEQGLPTNSQPPPPSDEDHLQF